MTVFTVQWKDTNHSNTNSEIFYTGVQLTCPSRSRILHASKSDGYDSIFFCAFLTFSGIYPHPWKKEGKKVCHDVNFTITCPAHIFLYSQYNLNTILKHLRQFVQSDWFLPDACVISHDRDTFMARRTLGMFAPLTHLAGLIH